MYVVEVEVDPLLPLDVVVIFSMFDATTVPQVSTRFSRMCSFTTSSARGTNILYFTSQKNRTKQRALNGTVNRP